MGVRERVGKIQKGDKVLPEGKSQTALPMAVGGFEPLLSHGSYSWGKTEAAGKQGSWDKRFLIELMDGGVRSRDSRNPPDGENGITDQAGDQEQRNGPVEGVHKVKKTSPFTSSPPPGTIYILSKLYWEYVVDEMGRPAKNPGLIGLCPD